MMALAVLAASASACSTSDKSLPVVKTVYVEREVPPAAKIPCAPPVPLPDRKLSDEETGSYWGIDRTSLRTCEARRAAGAGGTNVQ
jgi:hypothetical protein